MIAYPDPISYGYLFQQQRVEAETGTRGNRPVSHCLSHSAVLMVVPTTSSLALSPHHLLYDVVFILDCEYNYA